MTALDASQFGRLAKATPAQAQAPSGARYTVVHVGDPIVDPDSGKTLGFMGIYEIGRAHV